MRSPPSQSCRPCPHPHPDPANQTLSGQVLPKAVAQWAAGPGDGSEAEVIGVAAGAASCCVPGEVCGLAVARVASAGKVSKQASGRGLMGQRVARRSAAYPQGWGKGGGLGCSCLAGCMFTVHLALAKRGRKCGVRRGVGYMPLHELPGLVAAVELPHTSKSCCCKLLFHMSWQAPHACCG